MNTTSIADKNFVKKDSLTYELSILLGMDSFFYLIHDQNKHVLFLNEFEIPKGEERKDSIQDILINDKQLQLPYNCVKLGHTSTLFTLIPNKLYNSEITLPYLDQVSHLPSNHLAFVDNIQDLNMHNVYSIDEKDHAILSSYFPTADHFHVLSALLLGTKKIAAQLSEETLFINVDTNLISVMLFDQAKLKFANFFKFSNANEFLFYVMLVFEQLGLNPETQNVQISGKINKQSQEFDLLYKYIRHVHLMPSPSYFHLSSEFASIEQYHYFDIFSLNLCE